MKRKIMSKRKNIAYRFGVVDFICKWLFTREDILKHIPTTRIIENYLY